MARGNRSGIWRAALAALGLLGVSGALHACLIDELGIDEDCLYYCQQVQATCQGDDAVYIDDESCMAACRQMDRSEPGVTASASGNTLDCRLATMSRAFDPANCRAVGPGGNGVCGDDCTAFCSLRTEACEAEEPTHPDFQDANYCYRTCRGLPGSDALPGVPIAAVDDQLLCRMRHLSAALVSPEAAREHCQHTHVAPVEGSLCAEAEADVSSYVRKLYCSDVMQNCTDRNRAYKDIAECEKVSATFELGDVGVQGGDSVRCRQYHAGPTTSGVDAEEHCSHSTATGDEHCGSSCESYCKLLKTACPAGFADAYSDNVAGCAAQCAGLPGAGYDGLKRSTPRYSDFNADAIDALETPTLSCRVLHVVRALSAPVPDDPVECPAAFGGSPPCE